jgi:hypothetical protein
MIHDVDASLAALIRAEALAGGEAEVVFDPPTKEWASRRHAPAVDVFLYDIREDVSRRDISVIVVRDEDGNIVDRRSPPRRFLLNYLLTAWTRRPEDEHRLLSQLLGAFVKHDRIPQEHLHGQLADQSLAVILKLALPMAEHRSISDLWTALGGEMKPSLDLVVVAPLDSGRSYPAGPPVEDGIRIRLGSDNGLGGAEER